MPSISPGGFFSGWIWETILCIEWARHSSLLSKSIRAHRHQILQLFLDEQRATGAEYEHVAAIPHHHQTRNQRMVRGMGRRNPRDHHAWKIFGRVPPATARCAGAD